MERPKASSKDNSHRYLKIWNCIIAFQEGVNTSYGLILITIGCSFGRAQKVVRVGDALLGLGQLQRGPPTLRDACIPGGKRFPQLRLSLFQFDPRLFDQGVCHDWPPTWLARRDGSD